MIMVHMSPLDIRTKCKSVAFSCEPYHAKNGIPIQASSLVAEISQSCFKFLDSFHAMQSHINVGVGLSYHERILILKVEFISNLQLRQLLAHAKM